VGPTRLPSKKVFYLKAKNLGLLEYQKKIEDDSSTRCSRGLKVLSVKVRDIVYQKRQTSYKEVADALITESQFDNILSTGVNSSLKLKSKNKKKAREEQNVKRRVYDA
jgi:hypothetical protein